MLIEEELVKAAKEAKINMSETLREALSNKLKLKETVSIDDIISELDDSIKQAQLGKEKLLVRRQEIIDNKERENKEILDKFKDIPEVRNLTSEQINDTVLIMKLIDLIRDKYGRRFGIVDIKKYYELGGFNG